MLPTACVRLSSLGEVVPPVTLSAIPYACRKAVRE